MRLCQPGVIAPAMVRDGPLGVRLQNDRCVRRATDDRCHGAAQAQETKGATGRVGCRVHVATVRQQQAAIMSTGYSLAAALPTHADWFAPLLGHAEGRNSWGSGGERVALDTVVVA